LGSARARCSRRACRVAHILGRAMDQPGKPNDRIPGMTALPGGPTPNAGGAAWGTFVTHATRTPPEALDVRRKVVKEAWGESAGFGCCGRVLSDAGLRCIVWNFPASADDHGAPDAGVQHGRNTVASVDVVPAAVVVSVDLDACPVAEQLT
jgi:hypothetical protein